MTAQFLKRSKEADGARAIGDNPLSEDALDQVIEDSFPASDPPSHTPTTSLGAPNKDAVVESRGRRGRLVACVGSALAALFAVGGVVWLRRARG